MELDPETGEIKEVASTKELFSFLHNVFNSDYLLLRVQYVIYCIYITLKILQYSKLGKDG